MKTLKITTHWSPEEADCIYQLLHDLQAEIWEAYGGEITQLYAEFYDKPIQNNYTDDFNDEIPF